MRGVNGDGLSAWMEPQGQGGSENYIYRNVFWANTSGTDGACGNGVIAWTSTDYGALKFYNNTIYGLRGQCRPWASTAVADCYVRNNIWQNCENDPTPYGSVWTLDHNELNTGVSEFLDVANGDFRLVSPNAAGTDLGSPYDIDEDGVIASASWDAGAYNYADIINFRTSLRMRF
jgi:hypothetical protein